MSERIRLLLQNRATVECLIAAALKRDYPVNEEIEWERGAARYAGRVVMHCYGDRLKVRNDKTGRELFISADQIL